ncbi:UvrD-helicase domain-containing protein [Halorubrum sp. DTA46]|uniref:UvrD-helicase domain-containing protein n=1 Tax=Halorubrum sp. DTA46 TaxID=3402162 RepID=UPI003AAB42A3
MTSPNPEQRRLIDETDGIYLVDAGAGTGKTFTVTRRYANIVAQDDVDPDDVLLITFTRNAATEMRDRIVAHCEYDMRELADAPIQTFHSLCHDILEEHGFHAPSFLGIDDSITGSTRILEDETIERERFREFIDRFSDEHDEHAGFLRALSEPTELLELINTLASKGVFPTQAGWYRGSGETLTGDYDAFKRAFDSVNRPRNGGSKQSELRSRLGRYGANSCYLPDAPERHELRGERGSKSVPDDVAERVFHEDREDLISFVHDVYFEYLEFALGRNYLNFSFLQLFAFVACCEDERLRESLSFEYVMIDEFQDSSEIQFKLALLLSGTRNFCVVGDWKQSIYSFQYAAVENITEFESRLRRFADELNDDAERVTFPLSPINRIELERNYRSTQSILDVSEHALVTPGSSTESVDSDAIRERIVSLVSDTDRDHSRIEAVQHADEHEAVLATIGSIVGNDEYAVEEAGDLRAPTYDDIAVLTRTREYGRGLLSAAEAHDFPMAYEGGIELFRRDSAKLLLAWLRILQDGADADRGWAVVLERAGYTLDEIDHVTDAEAYPDGMRSFRAELASLETNGAVLRRVLDRYGYRESTADALLTTLESLHTSTTLTRGDLVRLITQGIQDGYTREVQAPAGSDSVTVQTVHSAKGLEYPIVIVANMNDGAFPPSGRRNGTIPFSERTGLRQRKTYAEAHGVPHVYDNWRADVLRRCTPTEHDEERRLLYVAMTRAKDHLLFAAGEEPNTFLTELPIDIESVDPSVPEVDHEAPTGTAFRVDVPPADGPEGYSPHSLMDDSVYEEVTEGRGTAFGSRVHEFAEACARGEDPTADSDDERHVAALIDSLSGELHVEERAYLPVELAEGTATISGIIDLVHVAPDRVEILDFKTDLTRHAESEYRTQLSVYYHVLDSWFPDRTVSASIFYTADDERVTIEPRSRDALRALVEAEAERE